MRYLRKSELEPLAISMCGLKLGHRFLVIGSSDPDLVWRLAGKVGLTGRACLLDESAAQTAAAAATVEQQGALVESFTAPFTSLPFEAGAFDAVVMRNALATIELVAPRRGDERGHARGSPGRPLHRHRGPAARAASGRASPAAAAGRRRRGRWPSSC